MKIDPGRLTELLQKVDRQVVRIHGEGVELDSVRKQIRALTKRRIPPIRVRKDHDGLYVWTDRAIAFQPQPDPDVVGWPRFWLNNNCAKLRELETEDELQQATVDLMLSNQITEKQMYRGLKIVRDRLRAMRKGA